jgi:flavin-binding protein dodecin
MKQRARKLRPIQGGRNGLTGRDGAIDLAVRTAMANEAIVASPDQHTYRVIELVGTSEKSVDDAIASAISRASRTLRHLRWFEVVRTSGHIIEGAVAHYQVTLKVGFTMEGPQ